MMLKDSTIVNDYGEVVSSTFSNHKGLGTKLSTSSGSTKIYYNSEKLLQDIVMKVMTPKGSVLGYPEYGSNLFRYKYSPLTQSTYDSCKEEMTSLLQSITGVEVIDVEVTARDTMDTLLIKFSILYNNSEITKELKLMSEGS